jgi:hypothetical protein
MSPSVKKEGKHCLYCHVYRTTPKSERNREEPNIRLCAQKKIEVGATTDACEMFVLAENFWCKKCMITLEPMICEARQNRNLKRCMGCLQGKVIKKLIAEALPKKRKLIV